MTSQKPGKQAITTSTGGESPAASAWILPTTRAGQSNAPAGGARTHTLVISITERPGAVDRVVGLLRRRRANTHTLTIGRSEQADVARITAVINDSEVGVEQLVEQVRKIVDVQHVTSFLAEHLVERELALIKVKSDTQHSHAIIELGQQYGAHIADFAAETVTLEVTGSTAQVEKLVDLLQPFGIREMARTGSVAMPRSI
jgi:acetolactate synthase I/III small subunit